MRKLLKIKGRFAQKLHGDAFAAMKERVGRARTVPRFHVEYYHIYIYPVNYFCKYRSDRALQGRDRGEKDKKTRPGGVWRPTECMTTQTTALSG